VGRARRAEQIAVRGASHQHHRLDGEGEGGEMRLWHIGDQPRALAASVACKRPAGEIDVAVLRREQAEQRLEQGRLAAAVRAEQRQHLAGRERDVEPAADHAVAVADREIAAREDHDHVLATLVSSQMKNGVPMSAVRMPSGISIAAPVRANVSISSKNPPPNSAAAGTRRAKSGPARVRATCGTTRPIQPMMPAVATLAEVTKVAAATIAMRNGPVGTPSARASSSGSDITFMRQRSAISTSVPSVTGPSSGSRSEALTAARLPSSQNVMAGSWLYGSARELTKP